MRHSVKAFFQNHWSKPSSDHGQRSQPSTRTTLTPTDLSPTFYRRLWSAWLLSDSVHTSSRSNFCPVVSPRTELVTQPRPPSSPCTTRLYVVSTPVTCVRLFLILAPHLIRSTIRHFFASLVAVSESKMQHSTGASRTSLKERWKSVSTHRNQSHRLEICHWTMNRVECALVDITWICYTSDFLRHNNNNYQSSLLLL